MDSTERNDFIEIVVYHRLKCSNGDCYLRIHGVFVAI